MYCEYRVNAKSRHLETEGYHSMHQAVITNGEN